LLAENDAGAGCSCFTRRAGRPAKPAQDRLSMIKTGATGAHRLRTDNLGSDERTLAQATVVASEASATGDLPAGEAGVPGRAAGGQVAGPEVTPLRKTRIAELSRATVDAADCRSRDYLLDEVDTRTSFGWTPTGESRRETPTRDSVAAGYDPSVDLARPLSTRRNRSRIRSSLSRVRTQAESKLATA
jgi:hypothetical protein